MRLIRAFGSEDGASVVEFALVLSLLAMLAFGTIQFGMAYNRYQSLQAASREGARAGAGSDTTVGGILDRVNAANSVGGAALVVPCTSPLTLNSGCVKVQRRNADNSLTNLKNKTDKPCAGAAQAVLVEASYRVQIQIPPVMSFPLTVSAGGEFGCVT